MKAGITGDRLAIADTEIASDRLDAKGKETMGHGRVQQRGNDPSMDKVGIPLKIPVGDKGGLHAALFRRSEVKMPGMRVLLTAEQTARMSGAATVVFCPACLPVWLSDRGLFNSHGQASEC